MIYEGMIEEALAIVKGARDRYDGIPRPPIGRNPWNEIECGGHYARAMSSWSLLLAASGFRCDGPAGTLEFAPNLTPERFKSFFSGPEGWGWLEQVAKRRKAAERDPRRRRAIARGHRAIVSAVGRAVRDDDARRRRRANHVQGRRRGRCRNAVGADRPQGRPVVGDCLELQGAMKQ